jgi:hypothetical protein
MWSLPLAGVPCALASALLGHASGVAALAAFYVAVAR